MKMISQVIIPFVYHKLTTARKMWNKTKSFSEAKFYVLLKRTYKQQTVLKKKNNNGN